MKQNLKCLRCDSAMIYVDTEDFQLGKTSFLLGDLPNLLSGAMRLEIYYCPRMDYPKCPHCGHDYR